MPKRRRNASCSVRSVTPAAAASSCERRRLARRARRALERGLDDARAPAGAAARRSARGYVCGWESSSAATIERSSSSATSGGGPPGPAVGEHGLRGRHRAEDAARIEPRREAQRARRSGRPSSARRRSSSVVALDAHHEQAQAGRPVHGDVAVGGEHDALPPRARGDARAAVVARRSAPASGRWIVAKSPQRRGGDVDGRRRRRSAAGARCRAGRGAPRRGTGASRATAMRWSAISRWACACARVGSLVLNASRSGAVSARISPPRASPAARAVSSGCEKWTGGVLPDADGSPLSGVSRRWRSSSGRAG